MCGLLDFKLEGQGGVKISLADLQFFQVLKEMQILALAHNIGGSNTFLEKACFHSMLWTI